MRYNAMEENFEEITVLGKPALFLDMRLDPDTVPKDLYLYEVRHGDGEWSDPVQIAKVIMVNHYGSIITREPIDLPPDGYLDINPDEDWDFSGGECQTVKEFQVKYPPTEKTGNKQE